MALVLEGFEVHGKLLGEGKGSRSKVWKLGADPAAVDDDAAFATARSQAVAMISAFNLLTGAVLTSYSLRGIYVEDAAVVIPSDANVYKEAFLTVGTNLAGTKKANHSIPAPADGMYSGDDETTGVIDVSNPQTLTYLAYFKAPNFFTVSDGEQMLSSPIIRKARVRSVGSGKAY